jgi:hypothetical protein
MYLKGASTRRSPSVRPHNRLATSLLGQLIGQLAYRLGAVRNRTQASHFTIWLCNRYGDRLRVDIPNPKNRNFSCMTGSLPLVALNCASF